MRDLQKALPRGLELTACPALRWDHANTSATEKALQQRPEKCCWAGEGTSTPEKHRCLPKRTASPDPPTSISAAVTHSPSRLFRFSLLSLL